MVMDKRIGRDEIYLFCRWLWHKIIGVGSRIFHTSPLLDRLKAETKKENDKAEKLRELLEAKKGLAEAREATQKLKSDIKAIK